MIIAIEGIDGAGKSLQLKLLRERLGADVLELSFPVYDTFIGREIGVMLSGSGDARADRVDARSMALWYAVDRLMRFRDISVTDYRHVLLNRYTLANAVYQSLRVEPAKRREFRDWVFALEHTEFALPRPDRYIILDTDTSASARNIEKKGRREYTADADVYERDRLFQDEVRALYRQFALELTNARLVECTRMGRLRTPGDINDEITELLGMDHV